MNAAVFWATIGGFLCGVFVRSFILLSWPFAAFAVLMGMMSIFYFFIDSRQRRVLIILSVACVALGAGIFRMDQGVRSGDENLNTYVGKKVTLEGVVSAELDEREAGTRVSIRAQKIIIGSTTIPAVSGILVLAPTHLDIAYGDVVRATGTLKLPEAFDTGSGRTFNYPQYLAKDGIMYQLAFAQVKPLGGNEGNPIQAAAINVKHAYLTGLGEVLSEPEAGLAGGITVGDKRSIGSELSAQFQKVSLIHMVVLSGYNITVVINTAARLLAWTPRAVQFGGSGLVVMFFVLMAGGAASAMRAGAMALLAMYARVSGRMFVAMRALGFVALLMVLWNPLTLAFDPSFQLSALATIGLVMFTPLCSEYLRWVSERFGLREILASTISTQLVVLPLLLYQNGNLSIVSLPANLFALIPVPFAMLASFIAAVCGMMAHVFPIVSIIAIPIAFPAYVLLAYIIHTAQFFAALPFASVSVPAFGVEWMFAAYALLFGGLWYLQKQTGLREESRERVR
jgi:competence protein ComEC